MAEEWNSYSLPATYFILYDQYIAAIRGSRTDNALNISHQVIILQYLLTLQVHEISLTGRLK